MRDDLKYCIKWLKANGVTADVFQVESEYLDDFDLSNYKIVKVTTPDFFDDLTDELRELWPQGEKDGKYSWRGSRKEIKERLVTLWKTRFQDKTYTIDMCLQAARKYLAQFEDNVKYMRILKYFILKQPKVVDIKDGSIRWGQKESLFADMLEGIESSNEAYSDLPEFIDEGELV